VSVAYSRLLPAFKIEVKSRGEWFALIFSPVFSPVLEI